MSVQGIQEAAKSAERDARALAAAVISAAAQFPDNEGAQINAETAGLIIANAEARARLVPTSEAGKRVSFVQERMAELEQQVEDGLIGRDAALQQLDQIKLLGFDLWLATHTRDAWESAVADFGEMLKLGRPDGA